ncbi:hypothetical protein MPTK1_1g12710 [Marchantia polymorpha subsp. ruderalis]|uniref:Uncharacterized protein n=2 Tax=Marchantia polymorpha TaxID=3197 RepID=A0AAF6APG7_MARPO|nr:hypothetical protein MARPO_0019s0041 [Marchantia polymorpha]BBM98337.1 hypothetical protein Mp_1g12710 [Marchantia polymorpha subsp. ruderalis]|eukprot:PTQ44604.1 hypothetical protein MARPO_0019s0041 [Marchantia polymorpha]
MMELTSGSAACWQIQSRKFAGVAACTRPCNLNSFSSSSVQFASRIEFRRSRSSIRKCEGRSTLVQIFCSSNFDDISEADAGSKVASDAVPGLELGSRSSFTGSLDGQAQDFDRGSGSGNENGNAGSGGGGGGGGGGDDGGGEGSDNDDEEFGPLLNSEQVQQELKARGITLPPDMLEAAKTVGIRKLFLDRFLEMQGGLLGKAMNASGALRNRMLADPTFIFKVFTEIAIDSACATVAEVQKRGKDFWNEFDFYLADLLVGIALDVLLVGLLAPFVRFGAAPAGSGASAKLSRSIMALPSSIFEAQRPGRTFTMGQRVATLFYKAGQYGVAGFSCGLIGQGVASSVMLLKRKLKTSNEHSEELKVPNVLTSAAVWAVFMSVSSNTRYQIINGLERVVESSVLTRRVPQVAMAFTVSIRLANNFYGAGQFVDWARLAGIQ